MAERPGIDAAPRQILMRVANMRQFPIKHGGKPVIAYGDLYDQPQYYLASHADEVYLDPQGIVYVDDKQIWREHKERMEPDEKGARVELAIRAMPPRVAPQASLLEQPA